MSLGGRIKLLRSNIARERFAPMTGVSKNTLIAYENNERAPGADYLNKLLELFPDIDPGWLLMGEGSMKRENKIKIVGGNLDEELLQAVMEAVEEYLDKIDGQLVPRKKAQLIVMLYDMFSVEGERKVDKATVIRLIKLAA